MRSGCDATTPCALERHGQRCHMRTSLGASGAEHCAGIRAQFLPRGKRMRCHYAKVASDSAAKEQHLLCASSALCVQRASQSSASCAFLKYPGGCTTSRVKAVEATAHPRDLHPGPSTCVAGVMALQLSHLFILRLPLRSQLDGLQPLDTLGFEPRAFRMRSGCDTTTPCAQ